MDEITLVTSNKNKFKEAQHIFKKFGLKLKHLDSELPEIRADELEPIIEKKAISAFKLAGGPAISDDTGLFIPKLNGFPGTCSGHFHKKLGYLPLLKLASIGTPAVFRCAVGYCDNGTEVKITVGEVEGKLVKPRGKEGWGFDPIFQPTNRKRTYAEDMEWKHENSHRALAFKKMAEWLSGT